MPISLIQILSGQKLQSQPIRANFQTIADKLNGNIRDADIATDAAINGAKLLDNSMAGVKFLDASVGSAKMAVGAALANLAAASIGTDKLGITIHSVAYSASVGTANNSALVAANPTATFAKATYDLLGLYLMNISHTSGASNLVHDARADNSGANWAGNIRVQSDGNGGGTDSGTLVYVFLKKVSG